MSGMKEITFEMQTESAKKVADALSMPDRIAFLEYITSIPFLVATIYSENPLDQLIFLMDSLKDEAVEIHTRMRKQARMREAEKL